MLPLKSYPAVWTWNINNVEGNGAIMYRAKLISRTYKIPGKVPCWTTSIRAYSIHKVEQIPEAIYFLFRIFINYIKLKYVECVCCHIYFQFKHLFQHIIWYWFFWLGEILRVLDRLKVIWWQWIEILCPCVMRAAATFCCRLFTQLIKNLNAEN